MINKKKKKEGKRLYKLIIEYYAEEEIEIAFDYFDILYKSDKII